ncbi:MAG: methylated-DNA--[protein]-cysteine S-methyltransferase [Clostridia bacterium]|nr:methylated-DNA--[protein]-cysteine S-methyltransferase [Clostridia bacterium]
MPCFTASYESPLGLITMICNEHALLGLWFSGQTHFMEGFTGTCRTADTPIFSETKRWLDGYFSGSVPDFTPPLQVTGSPFRRMVCDIMSAIPYGQTMTYGAIAVEVSRRMSSSPMSAQAVGGAVGHNPISLIIPCHRVMGAGGNLTGYAGGIERKIALLKLEGIDVSRLRLPKQKREP